MTSDEGREVTDRATRGGFFPHYIRPLRAASRYHFHSSTSHSLHSCPYTSGSGTKWRRK